MFTVARELNRCFQLELKLWMWYFIPSIRLLFHVIQSFLCQTSELFHFTDFFFFLLLRKTFPNILLGVQLISLWTNRQMWVRFQVYFIINSGFYDLPVRLLSFIFFIQFISQIESRFIFNDVRWRQENGKIIFVTFLLNLSRSTSWVWEFFCSAIRDNDSMSRFFYALCLTNCYSYYNFRSLLQKKFSG